MFRPTQGHPQANTEHTRINKVSTQWDPISFNSGYYKVYIFSRLKLKTQLKLRKVCQKDVELQCVRLYCTVYVHKVNNLVTIKWIEHNGLMVIKVYVIYVQPLLNFYHYTHFCKSLILLVFEGDCNYEICPVFTYSTLSLLQHYIIKTCWA
jgi:hypothetical protein